MADCVDDGHVTSDEYLDPRCEPCFDSKNRSIHVYGYCHECYQFMCPDCHEYHGKFPLAKNHVIVRGSKMPKSLADKPPKYERCDDHPKQWKDIFCYDHKNLVCSTCSDTNHKTCLTKSVEHVCKTITSSDTDALYDAVKNLNEEVNSVKDAVEADIKDIGEHQNHLTQEINNIHENAISKINKLFRSVQSEISVEYQSQSEQINGAKEKLTNINTRMQEVLGETRKLKGKSIDAKLFLKAHEHIQDINRIAEDFRTMNQSRRLVLLSFDHGNLLNEIMSDSATVGSLKKTESKPDCIEVKDEFPQSMLSSAYSTPVSVRANAYQQSPTLPFSPGDNLDQITTARDLIASSEAAISSKHQSQSSNTSQDRVSNQQSRSRRPMGNTARMRSVGVPVPLSRIKVAKQNSYNVKVWSDGWFSSCSITGMAITKDNRRLLVDCRNDKAKLFSSDMKFLSSVSVPDTPSDIAVVNGDTAVVTTENSTLVLLNISGRQLSIRRRVQLDYDVRGISSCQDKLVVTCPMPKPSSVRLIDQTGTVCWSVSTDQQGRQLFNYPWYVYCYDAGGTSTVVVSDWWKDTLTLLKAETGEVVTTRQLKGNKFPHGVSTDTAGNVYVCFYSTGEVSVLSADISEEKILRDGLRHFPRAIVYDSTKNQLIVSYIDNNNIDCFQLS